MQIRMTDGDGMEPREFVDSTLEEFLAANEEDAETCAIVSALKPGESVTLGGGAAPLFIVTARAS